MTRTVALLAALVVVAVVAAPAAGAATDDPVAANQVETPTPAANETAERPAPGAQLAGVVAVQGAEVEGEFEARSFGHQVAEAASNDSKASVVADRVSLLRERTAALQERRRALLAARENGTITQARFQAEMAALAARSGALSRQVNQTEVATRDLDPGLLAERGVDAAAIERLRADGGNLTGPETAAIARSIAGPDVGGGLSTPNNATVGPPTDVPGRNVDDRRRGGTPDGSVNITIRTTGRPVTPPGQSETSERPGRPTTDGDGTLSGGTDTADSPGQSGDRERGPPGNVSGPTDPPTGGPP